MADGAQQPRAIDGHLLNTAAHGIERVCENSDLARTLDRERFRIGFVQDRFSLGRRRDALQRPGYQPAAEIGHDRQGNDDLQKPAGNSWSKPEIFRKRRGFNRKRVVVVEHDEKAMAGTGVREDFADLRGKGFVQ